MKAALGGNAIFLKELICILLNPQQITSLTKIYLDQVSATREPSNLLDRRVDMGIDYITRELRLVLPKVDEAFLINIVAAVVSMTINGIFRCFTPLLIILLTNVISVCIFASCFASQQPWLFT